MNDEQLIGVIAERLHDEYCDESECDEDLDGFERYAGFAEVALAALREAGWDVYRPEDAPTLTIVDDAKPGESSRWGPSAAAMDTLEHSRPGTYRLVPVEGD